MIQQVQLGHSTIMTSIEDTDGTIAIQATTRKLEKKLEES